MAELSVDFKLWECNMPAGTEFRQREEGTAESAGHRLYNKAVLTKS